LLALETFDALAAASEPAPAYSLSTIDKVWSAHKVDFAIHRDGDRLFVGYYDGERQLVVASRSMRDTAWTYRKLDVRTGWDSHNYIAMATDAAGNLHVSGNMHNDPLVYFRTTKPGDVNTLERISVLVDEKLERRMTYPAFLRSNDDLVYKYRDGGSGNGNEIYVSYDLGSRRWRHLLATPLADGEGARNAYFVGPTPDGSGLFHLAWVWRETPDAETNHDLSYARSRDLVHWERSDGTPYLLPITLNAAEVVDAVPSGGGMINNNTVVGFDERRRPVITYHKFDSRGDTQIFLARREADGWQLAQISDWRDFRWDFRGRGSLESRLFVSGARPATRNRLTVQVRRDGKPIDFTVDSRTLKRVSEQPATTLAERLRPEFDIPDGMQLNTVEHASGAAIAWTTPPPNRDRPAERITLPVELKLVLPR
jgi:hypothetical protein